MDKQQEVCQNCKDNKWVCENHLDRTEPCCGGAEVPCECSIVFKTQEKIKNGY